MRRFAPGSHALRGNPRLPTLRVHWSESKRRMQGDCRRAVGGVSRRRSSRCGAAIGDRSRLLQSKLPHALRFCAGARIGAIGILLLLLAIGSIAAAKDPAAKKPPAQPPPGKQLEGLGFTPTPPEGDRGGTSLFGIVGEGYKFVYVIDRSGSMGGEGRKSLQLAKAELIRSFQRLDRVHQFQIVFYNERPVVFNPTGTPGRLAFATDENKQRAVRFLDKIAADGGTDHESALRVAIRLRPDVIFFLTDADDPKLSPGQLAKIRRLAAGIIINTVEFGPGPKPAARSFLAALAGQNGGKYAYIDISKRKTAAKPAKRGG